MGPEKAMIADEGRKKEIGGGGRGDVTQEAGEKKWQVQRGR